MALLSVSEARERLLAAVSPVKTTELIHLDQAQGRVLALDARSPIDLPPFPNSSMDGFAVRSYDLRLASPENPVTLMVIGDIPAGSDTHLRLRKLTCARIMTGAPLPTGADAVVQVEETEHYQNPQHSLLPAEVTVRRVFATGENVRPTGQDVHNGELLLEAGTILRARQIGLLAMVGLAQVTVYSQPLVALLSNGDELVPVEQPLTPGKIHDANTYLLNGLLQSCGVDVLGLGIAADKEEDVRRRLDWAVERGANLIISTAGVSVGAFDYVRAVIESEGKLEFWRVNVRPGKPLAFGTYRDIPLIGLPGNPVSSYVGFQLFVRPTLQKIAATYLTSPQTLRIKLSQPIESDGRESYLRAIVTRESDGYSVRLAGHQGSGNLFALAQANALLIVPSGVKSLPSGSDVEVMLLVD